MSNLQVVSMPAQPRGRILVTSDIHGHIGHLDTLLARAAFGADDLLVVAGDMIEKGPHCLAVVRRLMELCAQNRAIVLQGNVDNRVMLTLDELYQNRTGAQETVDYLLYMRDWKGSSFYDDLCREATGGVPQTAEELLASLDAVYTKFADVLDFVRNRPTVLKTDRYLFVHGGLPEGVEPDTLQSDETKDAYPFLKLDRFLDKIRASGRVFDRYVVCGHWPTALYCEGATCTNVLFDHDHRVICIDGGCGIKRDGQLNMLVLPRIDCSADEIECLSCNDFPTVTASHPQKASENPFSVRWTDSKVRIAALTDDDAEVEHITTKKHLRVPQSFLYGYDTLAVGAECNLADCSDYLLPVNEGDTLFVIAKTCYGIYAKKGGVSGWYI